MTFVLRERSVERHNLVTVTSLVVCNVVAPGFLLTAITKQGSLFSPCERSNSVLKKVIVNLKAFQV